jgi:integrase
MPLRQVSGDVSLPTSCVMRTPSSSAREGVSLNVVQRQLGHANLGTTSIYLQGIDIEEIISTVHARRAPMMSATAGLQL